VLDAPAQSGDKAPHSKKTLVQTLARTANASKPAIAARPPDCRTRSQISSKARNSGSKASHRS